MINMNPHALLLIPDLQTLVESYLEKLGILPLMSQYIFSILLFTVNNKALFQINSKIHSINTRYSSDFHWPFVNLTTYKNGTYYIGIKVFNYLPTHIKNLSHNVNQFRFALGIFFNFINFILYRDILTAAVIYGPKR